MMGKRCSGAPRALARLRTALALVMVSLFAVVVPTTATAQEAQIKLQAYRGFSDVEADDWYVESGMLDYVVDNSLMNGYTGTDLFGPWDNINRGQVACVLYNIAGEPQGSSDDFDDVDYSKYYGNAIRWAKGAGVINGYSGTNDFGPENPVTREELVTMLSNYADVMGGKDVSSDCAELDKIAGAADVSPWARTAMGWAVDNGVLSGDMSSGTAQVNPQGKTQRSQAAKMVTVLHRDILQTSPDDPDWTGADVDLNDNVKAIDEGSYEPTGNRSATISGGHADDIKIGDVVVLEPTDEYPSGNAIKVTRVIDADDSVEISGVEPEFDEVVDRLDTTGQGTEVVYLEPAAGVTVVNEIETQIGGSGSETLIDETFQVLKYGTLRVKSDVSYDVEWGPFKGFERLDLSVDVEGDFDFVATASTGKLTHKLASAYVSTPLAGLGVYIDFYVTFSASGTVEVWADAYAVAGVRCVNDQLVPYSDKDFDYGASFDGTASLGLEPDLMLSYLNCDLVDVSAEVGGTINGKLTNHQDKLLCCDLSAWLYLNLGIGQYDCLAKDWGLSKVFNIIDEHNSPKWEAHYENWHKVPDCTWNENADDPSDPDAGNPEGDNSDDGPTIDPDHPDSPDVPDNPDDDESDDDHDSVNSELEYYIGKNADSVQELFADLAQSGSTTSTITYSNSNIKVTVERDSNRIVNISLLQQCGYTIYDVYPTMGVTDASNALVANGAVYQDMTITKRYFGMPDGSSLVLSINTSEWQVSNIFLAASDGTGSGGSNSDSEGEGEHEDPSDNRGYNYAAVEQSAWNVFRLPSNQLVCARPFITTNGSLTYGQMIQDRLVSFGVYDRGNGYYLGITIQPYDLPSAEILYFDDIYIVKDQLSYTLTTKSNSFAGTENLTYDVTVSFTQNGRARLLFKNNGEANGIVPDMFWAEYPPSVFNDINGVEG